MHKKKINLADCACFRSERVSLPQEWVWEFKQHRPASHQRWPSLMSAVCALFLPPACCVQILNQNHQLLEKRFSPPWSIFKMVLCFWKIFFLTLKRKGSWCLSIPGKFYQRLTLSVRTSGFKRQNQKTETPKSRKLRFSNGNMASRVEKETER